MKIRVQNLFMFIGVTGALTLFFSLSAVAQDRLYTPLQAGPSFELISRWEGRRLCFDTQELGKGFSERLAAYSGSRFNGKSSNWPRRMMSNDIPYGIPISHLTDAQKNSYIETHIYQKIEAVLQSLIGSSDEDLMERLDLKSVHAAAKYKAHVTDVKEKKVWAYFAARYSAESMRHQNPNRLEAGPDMTSEWAVEQCVDFIRDFVLGHKKHVRSLISPPNSNSNTGSSENSSTLTYRLKDGVDSHCDKLDGYGNGGGDSSPPMSSPYPRSSRTSMLFNGKSMMGFEKKIKNNRVSRRPASRITAASKCHREEVKKLCQAALITCKGPN